MFIRLSFLIVIILSVNTIFAQFAGGSGTEDDPYLIETAQHLDNVRDYLDAYFLQIDDIELGESPWNTGEGWLPIGEEEESFLGIFDGDGFTISNLMIDRTGFGNDNQGLFGHITGAVLKNIKLENVDVTSYRNTGGLVGYSVNGTIEYCEVYGSVSGSGNKIGGIVGESELSFIENSAFEGTVSGHQYVGGLIGYVDNNTQITACYTDSDASGYSNVGGIAGYHIGGSIINQSLSTGTISANTNVGGLVGFNIGSLMNSYSNADISGNYYLGGLIGADYGNVNNCFSFGYVEPGSNSGGLIGHGTSTVVHSYWDIETSGISNSAGGEGRTTEEMTYPYADNTYMGWDFNDTWTADEEHHYNDGYPILSWQLQAITVAMPTSDPPGGTYTESITVTLSCETETAEIRYTTDGSEPDEEATLYIDPIEIEGSLVLKAKGFKNEWIPSETMMEEYIILLPPANLLAEVGDDYVELFWEAPGDSLNQDRLQFYSKYPYRQELLGYNIYRAENDDFELISSVTYENTTYLDEGLIPGEYSYYVTAYYSEGESAPSNTVTAIIPDQVATPTFSPDAGYYTEPIYMEIFCDTENAEIFFTLDSSEPTQESIFYTEPVYLDSTVTVKARAFKSDWLPSEIADINYEIEITSADKPLQIETTLLRAYPNPFNPHTTIQFSLAEPDRVTLDIFNTRGQQVRRLVKVDCQAGEHKVSWDGKNDKGDEVSGGVYYYRFRAGEYVEYSKLILLK